MPYKDPEKQRQAQRESAHRRRSHINRHVQKKRDELRLFIDTQKLGQMCVDCGVEYPPFVMDYHHVRGEKKFNIGRAANQRYTLNAIRAEIEKCVLLCANCHRIRHKGNGL